MSYYAGKLGGKRLRECYEVAPSRVRQYLDAEVRFVVGHLEAPASVLELGCGYGRVALQLAAAADRVVGIDTSRESLILARELAQGVPNCEFFEMDALALQFPNEEFDYAVCVQNGICAFGVDPEALVLEAARVVRQGGRLLFSTYAESFWPHRLEWFEVQAQRRLVGKIDYNATGEGTIVCKDGFRAGIMTPTRFKDLCRRLKMPFVMTEVDGSSVFYEVTVENAA